MTGNNKVPTEIREAAAKWRADEGSALYVLTGQFFDRRLADQAVEEVRLQPNTDTIDVILDSGGGHIEAAYQLVEVFRSRCRRLRVFVPDWAKSAATLLCLGADEVWLTCAAEMGPLDAQIPDPRDPDSYISALEEFQAVDYLRTVAFETLDQVTRLLIRRTQMRMRDVLSEARAFATQLVQPLYAQVDPLYFGTAHRALETSTEYGRRVMSRYAYKDWTEDEMNELLEHLTWNYSAHSFVIDYQEALELKLKVFLLDGQREEDAYLINRELPKFSGFLLEDEEENEDDLNDDLGREGED